MGILSTSKLKKSVIATAAIGAALGGLGVPSMPAMASAFCKCEIAEGPFKTWIMLDTRTVALFDCRTGEIVGQVKLDAGCNSIVTKQDCSTVFVGTVGDPATGKPPSICDIDCETFEIIDRPLPGRPIPNGLICKDNFVIVAMENGLVGFLDCDTGEFRFVQVGGGCNSIISKCDGRTIFVGTQGDPATGKAPGFCDIDCETLEVIERPLPAPPNANAFWLSPDNRWLWIMLQDFSVAVFDCELNRLAAVVPVGGGCNSIKGKCDGSRVFVGNVGGVVPQQFFPSAGFGQQLPDGTGNGFVIDQIEGASYEMQIELPGQGVLDFTGKNALQGQVCVGRGSAERSFDDPTSNAVIPLRIQDVNVWAQSQGVMAHIELLEEFQNAGQVVGGGSVFQGDFPAQPVDSFFDITYQLSLVSPNGEAAVFLPEQPIRHELDPLGPPLQQVPFGCDKWRVPQIPGVPGIPLFQDPNNFNDAFPPQIFVRCDVLCFPPPPPPKEPGVCDIPLGTFVPFECDLPAPPINCGVKIDALTGNIWVAMQNGTVGVWDCNWNPIFPDITVGGGCTTIDFKPDFSTIFVGTAGNTAMMKPPGICDIDPNTFQVTESPTPGVPLPKGIRFCQTTSTDICEGDCNGDGIVDFADLIRMLFLIGSPGTDECDADNNGTVDFGDLVTALFSFGPCP